MEILTLIISAFALLISVSVFVLQYLVPGKVEIYVGDSLQIVHTEGKNKIQLNCNFTNTRHRLGVINKIDLKIISPDGEINNFKWNIFYEFYRGWNAKPSTRPTSLSVVGRGSLIQGIEFISDTPFTWSEGRYEIIVMGWFVNKVMKKRLNFFISIDKDAAEQLKNTSKINGNTTRMSVVNIEYS